MLLSQTPFQGMLVSSTASVNIGHPNAAVTDTGLANATATITGLVTFATELMSVTIFDHRSHTLRHVP